MISENTPSTSVTLRLTSRIDALACPAVIARRARESGLGQEAVHRVQLVASELATNLVRHAGGGTIAIEHTPARPGVVMLTAKDRGPGFADIEAAIRDGVSQGKVLAEEVPPTLRTGLGSGLGAVHRLADSVEIVNRENGGACVRASVAERTRRR